VADKVSLSKVSPNHERGFTLCTDKPKAPLLRDMLKLIKADNNIKNNLNKKNIHYKIDIYFRIMKNLSHIRKELRKTDEFR
jgi:hypothetical protein